MPYSLMPTHTMPCKQCTSARKLVVVRDFVHTDPKAHVQYKHATGKCAKYKHPNEHAPAPGRQRQGMEIVRAQPHLTVPNENRHAKSRRTGTGTGGVAGGQTGAYNVTKYNTKQGRGTWVRLRLRGGPQSRLTSTGKTTRTLSK